MFPFGVIKCNKFINRLFNEILCIGTPVLPPIFQFKKKIQSSYVIYKDKTKTSLHYDKQYINNANQIHADDR